MEAVKHRKPASKRREAIIRVRVTSAQKRKLIQAAENAGLDMSAWIRLVALKEAGSDYDR